ncbi:MAG: DUF2203 domain-containing protein [Actinomycetota bacterium]
MRTYTAAEAEACLPALRGQLSRIREARRTLIASSRRITDAVAADGGGVAGSDWFEASRQLRQDVTDLADRDILLRDPDTGLVDFPAEREGRIVFLCWRANEEGVTSWHEQDSGILGRKPL